MPRTLSAWFDAGVFLAVCGALAAALFSYNPYLGSIAAVLWLALAFFARERHRARAREFERYFRGVAEQIRPVMNYAVEKLPQAVLIVNADERLEWGNRVLAAFVGEGFKAERGVAVRDFWPEMILKPIWGMTGSYVFRAGEVSYRAEYRPVPLGDGEQPLMAFYVMDVTEQEHLRADYEASRLTLAYIQIDNYDEVLQGLVEAERQALVSAVTTMLDGWAKELGCLLQRFTDEKYVAVMERRALERAMADGFDILDRVRGLKSTNRQPVTLSVGAALAEPQALDEAARQAQKKLDLALGRGGDQVAVLLDGKTQFFGGKAQAVEKHTRVKARVVAHAIRELVEGADEVLVMGHKNEDFDALGAAMGVAKMARHSKKPVHIVLSDLNEGIDKFMEKLPKDKPEYTQLFVHEDAFEERTFGARALLIVVDTHIPHLVAAPKLLAAVPRIVLIDHHRRSESMIENPLLLYHEPSSSSTSELVTELLMYYAEDLKLARFDATALYAGIVVDTKHFGVQTGVRTLEAAAYLRRAGADPVLVRQLFREDYDTNRTIAKAMAGSSLYPGGLIVASCPDAQPNIQAIAAQAADALLLIEGVQMSIVVFQLTADTVGISARATGERNVQVVMEAFGGGGHQNVAGAQVRGASLKDIRAQVVELAQKYIEENG